MLVPRQIASLGKIAAKESGRYSFNGVRLERTKDGKARAIATDGRRALIATWDEADGKEYPPIDGMDFTHVDRFAAILPVTAIDRAAKAVSLKLARSKPVLGNIAVCEPSANGYVKLGVNRLDAAERIEAQSIEGTFPPVDDCVPEVHEVHGPQKKGEDDAGYITMRVRVKKNAANTNNNLAAVVALNIDLLRGLLDAMGKAGAQHVTLSVPCCIGNRPVRLDAKTEDNDGIKLTGILMPVNRNA